MFKKNVVFVFNFCVLVEEKRIECRGKESSYDGNIFWDGKLFFLRFLVFCVIFFLSICYLVLIVFFLLVVNIDKFFEDWINILNICGFCELWSMKEFCFSRILF